MLSPDANLVNLQVDIIHESHSTKLTSVGLVRYGFYASYSLQTRVDKQRPRKNLRMSY